TDEPQALPHRLRDQPSGDDRITLVIAVVLTMEQETRGRASELLRFASETTSTSNRLQAGKLRLPPRSCKRPPTAAPDGAATIAQTSFRSSRRISSDFTSASLRAASRARDVGDWHRR